MFTLCNKEYACWPKIIFILHTEISICYFICVYSGPQAKLAKNICTHRISLTRNIEMRTRHTGLVLNIVQLRFIREKYDCHHLTLTKMLCPLTRCLFSQNSLKSKLNNRQCHVYDHIRKSQPKYQNFLALGLHTRPTLLNPTTHELFLYKLLVWQK